MKNISVPLDRYINALLGTRLESIIEIDEAFNIMAVEGWNDLVVIEDTNIESLKRMLKKGYADLLKSGANQNNREELLEACVEKMFQLSRASISKDICRTALRSMTTAKLEEYKNLI